MLVFFAYAAVTNESATLFVDDNQVDEVVREHLGTDVVIQPYDSFFPYLKGLNGKLGLGNEAVRSIHTSQWSGTQWSLTRII